MSVIISGKPLEPAKPPKKKKSGHTKAKAYLGSLNEPGRFRIANWMAILNLSHSAIYERWKHHFYYDHPLPPPDGYDPRPYWHTETVLKYIQG